MGAVASTHLEHVAKSLRGDQADACALALEERIGADRRAVHDRPEAIERPESRETRDEARGLVAAMGRDLGGAEAPLRLVIEEEIGEGAPDVDADDARRAPIWASTVLMRPSLALLARLLLARLRLQWLHAHIAFADVALDTRWIAQGGIAPAAAAGGLEPHLLLARLRGGDPAGDDPGDGRDADSDQDEGELHLRGEDLVDGDSDERTDEHADRAADRREQRGLEQELPADVAAAGAERAGARRSPWCARRPRRT